MRQKDTMVKRLTSIFALIIYINLPRISIGIFNTRYIAMFFGLMVAMLLVWEWLFKKYFHIRANLLMIYLYVIYIIVQFSLLVFVTLR